MMPDTVSNHLHRSGVAFSLIRHPPTTNSQETAKVAHVPGNRLAKAVVLEDGDEFVLAVIPASRRLDRWAFAEVIKRPFSLAEEHDFAEAFRDCRRGAVPALGPAYGIHTYVDVSLLEQPDVYFECGDHEQVVHVDRDGFKTLMAGSEPAEICC